MKKIRRHILMTLILTFVIGLIGCNKSFELNIESQNEGDVALLEEVKKEINSALEIKKDVEKLIENDGDPEEISKKGEEGLEHFESACNSLGGSSMSVEINGKDVRLVEQLGMITSNWVGYVATYKNSEETSKECLKELNKLLDEISN